MIYAFSVIKGFNSLRGNLYLHISLAITMLGFVRIPKASSWFSKEDESEVEEYPASDIWYVYAIVLHFLTAASQYMDLYIDWNEIEPFAVLSASLQIPITILQVYNLIILLTYFIDASPFEELSSDNQQFEFWVYIESSTIVATICANMLFLAVRTIEKVKIKVNLRTRAPGQFDH